ncbi:MAG: hypothetical protein AB1817_15180 [Chloroflexota bacterium]
MKNVGWKAKSRDDESLQSCRWRLQRGKRIEPDASSTKDAITMTNFIIKRLTPEEAELDRKKIELAVLENELAERELDRSTLDAEWCVFSLV